MTRKVAASSAPRNKWYVPWWVVLVIMAAIIVTPLVLAGYTMLHG